MMLKLLSLVIAFLTLSYSTSPALASYTKNAQVFGGNGSTARNITGNTTETYPASWQYRSYTSNAGTTHTLQSGTTINTVGPIVISGAIVGEGGSGGGEGSIATPSGSGGTGGSCIGAGGYDPGGNDNRAGDPSISIHPGLTGSGGQSARKDSDANGYGGKGGARLIFVSASAITVNSTGSITADGGQGLGTTQAGGGGSGGVIGLFSLASVSTVAGSMLSVKGGQGGNASNKRGSGGGGGLIYVMAPVISMLGSTSVVAGAQGSGNGNGTAGQPGAVISVVGTPCHPLVVWMMDHPKEMRALASLKGDRLDAMQVIAFAFNDGIRQQNHRFIDLIEERRCVA